MSLALSKKKQHPFTAVFATVQMVATGLALLTVNAGGDVWAQSEYRVGMADNREGYESPHYATNSEAILETFGERLPLADIANAIQKGLPGTNMTLRAAEVDLGRTLFFDRRLSTNSNLSCGMCHVPEQGFTQNELATPVGDEGRGGRRNAPSLYNVAFLSQLFWDGRESSLVAQVWSPLLARNEMANPSRQAVIRRLEDIPAYSTAFNTIFADGLTEKNLGRALASYQRALVSGDSPFDRWYFQTTRPTDGVAGFKAPEIRGFEVFLTQGCQSCHSIGEQTALFTDGMFHNTGTGFLRAQRGSRPQRLQVAPGVYVTPQVDVETEKFTDDGRVEVSGAAEDRWRYRTPSLRNVGLTAPYMHDGSLATLEAVVQFYAEGGGGDPAQDSRIRPLHIPREDQAALVLFLQSLTGSNVDALVADARSAAIGDTLRHDYVAPGAGSAR